MNKREFLKAGGTGLLAAAATRPATAAAPAGRIAILQQHLPGAEAFEARERAAGARLMVPAGDPARWFRSTLQPVLGTATVVGFTDPTHALILETSLREVGYTRAVTPAHSARGTLWSVSPRL
jgi:hypothetical protein